ncbi:MAG: iron export ABC transporter permease subunit FetB [Desulfocapsa sp.]|uniref:Iron export ABC transporter permease subunit FetB n=1 Tax=Desulfotalea psychrophila TaxID=84980 RepID=A0ABS3AU03_9BACT|nr:iron export ABC transporter permease subunit FetB [Desulfocapsa sp.]MBN4068452.1 iron export ABC transporter permease subunit FetB [Desulfotalea psychrophila]
MDVLSLSAFDLSLAAILLLMLAVTSFCIGLGLEKRLVISGIRMTLQLLLIGLVLQFLFANASFVLVFFLSICMLLIAGYEVWARQKRKLRGTAGYLISTGSMLVSSFTVTFLALTVMVGVDPWYTPQYAIPLLGMLLGNTMTGVALAADRLTTEMYSQRGMVEQRLLLGQNWQEASGDIRRDCMRTGMIPVINSMAAAGVVSLPGMMTGQILGGSSPLDAIKYQILIMFLIAAGTGFGVLTAIWLISRRLFDERQRLVLECLESPRQP